MGQEYVNYGEVLYAPSIHIEDNWLKTAALYYDRIHRIVQDYIEPFFSNEAMLLQKELGLVNNLYPTKQKEIEIPFTDFAKREALDKESLAKQLISEKILM